MKLPWFLSELADGNSPTRLLQGFVAGVIITVVVGFTWGGWQPQYAVGKKLSAARESARVAALAPICAANFQLAAKADSELIPELKTYSSWERRGHLRKAGWASFPGEAEADGAVANACATLLAASLKLDE